MSRLASPALAAELMGAVAVAEAAFRSRWRMSTLMRIDAELHDRVLEQIALYQEEMIAGLEDDLRLQAAAMVRGWAAACARMEGHADDAYLVGVDHSTKTRIVVSEYQQSIEHVRAATPISQAEFRLVALSPDEVAKLVGASAVMAAVKAAFPAAEILSVELAETAA